MSHIVSTTAHKSLAIAEAKMSHQLDIYNLYAQKCDESQMGSDERAAFVLLAQDFAFRVLKTSKRVTMLRNAVNCFNATR